MSTNLSQISGQWPNKVGIVAMEMYFPNTFVAHSDLEKYNGQSPGKYTIGLGQQEMAFCSDREDINSICLTVTKNLLEKYSISPKNIGFLMVGTETIIDKSKSIKTTLMTLFAESGNTDIEGLHTTNACYGGTAALFHAIDWLESSQWDGRYAMVVAADIAIYDKGPARPTGGCAGVAMLVGPNAPLVFDRKVRSTYVEDVFDFYKPKMDSEYALVDGHQSIICYHQAVDKCFKLYFNKASKNNDPITFDQFDAMLFHSPYCKLVQKTMARLFFLNYLKSKNNPDTVNEQLKKYKKVNPADTYEDKELENTCMTLSKNIFDKKTSPSLMLARRVGNMYTASLYSCLISLLLSEPIDSLLNKRVLLFSYGSGMAASMFSLRVTHDGSALSKLINGIADIPKRLDGRHKLSPPEWEAALELREKAYNKAPYKPIGGIELMTAGTYYLTEVNDKYQRSYKRIANDKN